MTRIVTAYMLGLAVGTFVYGPFAARFGRTSTLYVGYGISIVGAQAATLAPSLG